MFGLHSYRCLRAQKWLRAFNLIRERHEACHIASVLQHSDSWMTLNRKCVPVQVHLFSTSSGEIPNVLKITEQDDLQVAGKANETETKDLDRQHAKDDNNKEYLIHLLDDCIGTVHKAKKDNNAVSLWKVLPKSFNHIVDMSMQPNTSSVLRRKCLKLLLTESEDHELTERLLMQTLEDSNHLPLDILVDTLQQVSESKPTALRLHFRKDLTMHIVNKRWHEMGQKHIVSVMYQLDELFDMRAISYQMRSIYKTTNAQDTSKNGGCEGSNASADSSSDSDRVAVQIVNLERHILDVVDKLKPKDLVRILTLMGKWKRRNQTLLAAVIHRLCLGDMSDFNYIQLTNLLFACAALTIHNNTFLGIVSKQLASYQPFSQSLTTSVLIYLSQLKWYDKELVSKCLDYVGEHSTELTGKQACSILMSVANLYALPSVEECNHVISALGNVALTANPSNVDTVNVMWSLAILQSLDKDKVASVLEPSFLQHFQDATSFQNRSCLQKLRQISTAAEMELSSYEGPYFHADGQLEPSSREAVSKAEQGLRSSLSDALKKFVCVASYVREGKQLPGGYTADALMCCDADGTLKPLSELDKVNDPEKKLHRLAIKVIPFKGVIGPQQQPAGVYQMEWRHMKALGYTPVPVLYPDLHINKSILEHVTAIQRRIKECVDETSNV